MSQYWPVGNGDMLNIVVHKNVQLSLSLTFWPQITYQSFSTYWNMFELRIFWACLTNSQIESGFKAWPLN
jgi:hypothetical protein